MLPNWINLILLDIWRIQLFDLSKTVHHLPSDPGKAERPRDPPIILGFLDLFGISLYHGISMYI